MNDRTSDEARFRELLSLSVDGETTQAEAAELNDLLIANAEFVDRYVDHLLLDSLLEESLGRESLTELIDTIALPGTGEPQPADTRIELHTRRFIPLPFSKSRLLAWGSWAAMAAMAIFMISRMDSNAVAGPESIVRAAIATHDAFMERVYLVEIQKDLGRQPHGVAGFARPREMRVVTRGDRFYVEVARGDRSWFWGRQIDGTVWTTLGRHLALRIAPEELGPSLAAHCELFSLNLTSILQHILKHHDLTLVEESESTYVVRASTHDRGDALIRSVEIEVDKDTKAIRRLFIRRELPKVASSSMTFTLVETRPAGTDAFEPLGHLQAPYLILDKARRPDIRRALLVGRFGDQAKLWITARSDE